MSGERDFGWEFLDQIKDWIGDYFDPEDVFDEKKLNAWAEENGWIRDE